MPAQNNLKAALRYCFAFGWVRHRQVYRQLYQAATTLRQVPLGHHSKDTLRYRLTNHDLELDERRATASRESLSEDLRHCVCQHLALLGFAMPQFR